MFQYLVAIDIRISRHSVECRETLRHGPVGLHAGVYIFNKLPPCYIFFLLAAAHHNKKERCCILSWVVGNWNLLLLPLEAIHTIP